MVSHFKSFQLIMLNSRAGNRGPETERRLQVEIHQGVHDSTPKIVAYMTRPNSTKTAGARGAR